jgi:hypothetical protein
VKRALRSFVAGLVLCAMPAVTFAQPFGPSRKTVFLPTVTITTAVTALVGETVFVPQGATALSIQGTFVYGSGGTTAKVWVQTSLDGGTTWIDIANFAYTTSSLRNVNSVRIITAVGANYTATDGTLADNTIKDGILGDRVRVKWTTTGTYAGGTTLKLDAVFQ